MAALPTRRLGRTGLEVTALGFGAMELRGRRSTATPEGAKNVLNMVLDGGINYIDTSIDYGISEEHIGAFIADRRNEYYLASKCGCPVGEISLHPPWTHDYSKQNIVAGVEQSLRRLRTDHLDLLQVHMSPSKQELEREAVVETLRELQAAGKTRFLGISSTLPELPDHLAMGAFDVIQIPYSALDRSHEESIAETGAADVGVVIRGGVGKGLPNQGRSNEQNWARFQAAKLDELSDGMTEMEFLLRFTISHPEVDTTIVGTQDPDHLAANLLAASHGPLAVEVYNEAKRRLDALS